MSRRTEVAGALEKDFRRIIDKHIRPGEKIGVIVIVSAPDGTSFLNSMPDGLAVQVLQDCIEQLGEGRS